MSGVMAWDGTITAVSSIAHGMQTRGTTTLLRREIVVTDSGELVHVPVISGNTIRGRLRRIGEEILRDELHYEGELCPAAAHALRGGGALAKTTREPLSGHRLARLRELVPQIGVFGAAGGGTIISGALDVGKLIPHVSETSRITGVFTQRSAFAMTQLESYARQDDSADHDAAPVTNIPTRSLDEAGCPDPGALGPSQQMFFHVETFPAGTVFSCWLRLRRPTLLEAAFFTDVLGAFCADGRVGGRVGIGHGRVQVDLSLTSEPIDDLPDWRAHVRTHREEILAVLDTLA